MKTSYPDANKSAAKAVKNFYAILYACGATRPIPLTLAEIDWELASARRAKDESMIGYYLKLRHLIFHPHSKRFG